jgi:hypothetical protein
MKKIISMAMICLFFFGIAIAQIPNTRFNDGMKIYLSKDSVSWLKATVAIQTWVRYNDNNPGSTVNGFAQKNAFDIGIRRFRMQLFGQITKKVFFYSQFGINNFNSLSPRKQGAFLHDLTGEYALLEKHLSLGTGLSGWSGLSRYASPSIAATLMYDAPLFEQTTNDVTDQFLRKLSIYAKGKLSRLDYRLAVSKPLPVQTSINPIDTTLSQFSTFAPNPPKLQYQGYFNWQFLDQESNLTPYFQGTYLGKKRVFNIGAGAIYQPEAMRHAGDSGQKIFSSMSLLAIDVFFDSYINKEKQNAITLYGGYFNFDFGPKYIRNSGVMNVANGSANNPIKKISGFGNAFPMYGTGNVLYLQGGYLFKKDLLGKVGTLQPVADVTVANYKGLNMPMVVYDFGVNLLFHGHNSKLSLNYQSRPVFSQDAITGIGNEIKSARKGMGILQYQIFF